MNSPTQIPPEVLSSENTLICEKLLGWEVRPRFGNNPCGLFFPDGRVANGPYSFTTWAEAGLILDALAKAGQRPDTSYYDGWCCFVDANCGDDPDIQIFDTGPSAVRAAALQYVRSLP